MNQPFIFNLSVGRAAAQRQRSRVDNDDCNPMPCSFTPTRTDDTIDGADRSMTSDTSTLTNTSLPSSYRIRRKGQPTIQVVSNGANGGQTPVDSTDALLARLQNL